MLGVEKVKIGTLSLNINTNDLNYGALLHSWAFQQVLKNKLNIKNTEIIDYIPSHFIGINFKYPIITSIKGFHPRGTIKLLPNTYFHAKRYEKFKDFVDKNMVTSKSQYNVETLNQAELDYDCIICESDVIWSPNSMAGNFDPTFFMALDSMKDKRRIAYAPSLANAEFTKDQEEQFTGLLKNVDYISCRERYAAEYTSKFTDKRVSHVLDPTLLLNEKDYLEITEKRLITEKYLLIYFPLQFMPELVKQAKSYAKKRGLKVVEISSYVLEKFKHKTYTDAGIGEFLSLVKNAEVVFSNSFHGVCFSVLFEKEFYAYSRKTGRKIEDICKLLGLENRFIRNFNFSEQEPIDYNKINRIISEERIKSIEWLKESIYTKEN